MYDYYMEETKKLRSIGKDLNLTDTDIDRIIDESFKFLENETSIKKSQKYYGKKKFIIIVSIIIAVIAVLCFFSNPRKIIHGYIERNFQALVYPGMKLLRKIMLPVIKTFPSLTQLYDEACLIGNPYFQVSDIDCWPCENVKSILNLTVANLSNEDYHSGIPIILRDENLKEVDFQDLVNMYSSHKEVFDKDAGKTENILPAHSTPEHVFLKSPLSSNPSLQKNFHVTWKLNRLEPVRQVRQTFGTPRQVPFYVSGATIEKWLLIDEANASPYELPWTEGTTVFLIQGSGSRLISLEPSVECLSSCHRVSILLRPKHILWFNWWYWRGKSLPVNTSHNISITYVGSYY